ncbi:MAG: hypothetical protein HY769_03610 [Candidatus Stahlbacteria bacterium]|nr:hypothetical protein [Candidatus Stahlbacteria bacterium]
MVKLLKILGIVSISAIVWGSYIRIDKDYGLRVHISLGGLCEQSVAIVVGEVISMEEKITGYMEFDTTSYWIETDIRIRVWEDLKEKITDSLVTIRICPYISEAPKFSLNETVLVFLEDTHRVWDDIVLFDIPDPSILFVVGKELGKFKVVNNSVRADRYTRNAGIEVGLVKDLVRSAIKYPVTVDAKLDTLYEEGMRMYREKVGYDEIIEFVYNKLGEIIELGK